MRSHHKTTLKFAVIALALMLAIGFSGTAVFAETVNDSGAGAPAISSDGGSGAGEAAVSGGKSMTNDSEPVDLSAVDETSVGADDGTMDSASAPATAVAEPSATPTDTAQGTVPLAPYSGNPIMNFTDLQAAIAAFNSGSANMEIVIGADIVIPSNLTISGSYTLTISSDSTIRTLTRGFSDTSSTYPPTGLFIVDRGATLTMENIIVDGDKSTYTDNKALLVAINSDGMFTMGDGAVLQNNISIIGGGVGNYGMFNMNGSAVISNNTAFGGGGVYNAGMFTMDDSAVISGNTARSGGGVYNDNIFTMSGSAVISNNAAAYGYGGGDGGGVYNVGTFTMNGSAQIRNNTSKFFGTGGGVLNSGTFSMSDSTVISGNKATVGGGIDWNTGTIGISGSPKIGSTSDNNAITRADVSQVINIAVVGLNGAYINISPSLDGKDVSGTIIAINSSGAVTTTEAGYFHYTSNAYTCVADGVNVILSKQTTPPTPTPPASNPPAAVVDNPQTGDNSHVTGWIIAFSASLLMIVVFSVVFIRQKKQSAQKTK